MTVLVVEPMKKPYVKESGPDLHALQAEVGGNIATSYPFDNLVGQVLNDEGKLISLDLNRSLQDKYGEIYDIVAVTTGGRQTGVWVAESPRQARPAEEAPGVGHLISRSKKNDVWNGCSSWARTANASITSFAKAVPSLQAAFPGDGGVLSALSFPPFQKVRELWGKIGEKAAYGDLSV